MPSIKLIIITGIVIYVVSQIIFLINIQFPTTVNFDESHYVPSAKQYLNLEKNQNWEHPPLGKEIMALGIAIFGDNPIGWRFMSTLFGALTLVGMYLWAIVLFKNESTALFVVFLTLCNNLLYVQSRIGMLDTFMFAFLVWGIASFCALWSEVFSTKITRFIMIFMGVCFGLAMATKWFSLVPWMLCIGIVVFIRLLQFYEIKFANSSKLDWYHPKLWNNIPSWQWITCLGVVPVVIYFITFIPLLFLQTTYLSVHSIWDLFGMQKQMWNGQLRVTIPHPYMSQWYEWAILKRPIWYAFDKDPSNQNFVRGVILIGNPLIMWSGLIAILECAYGWITTRRREAFLILFFYLGFYLCWIVIPRKVSFYYYYYPSGMVLSLALAYIFHYGEKPMIKNKFNQWPRVFFGTAALVLFIYFFPILAGLRIGIDKFHKWMWFSSWI